jgi:hypothetical protein
MLWVVQAPREEIAPMADELICPICKTQTKPIDHKLGTKGYNCENHKQFYVTYTALKEHKHKSMHDWEAALRWAKTRAKPGEWPTINSYDFEKGSPPP